ncbi:phosphonate metabolism protein PhnM [Desulfovibrio sp. X2]|uniref:alpha-D-ribose 1-methylphosphonate 5-triphosphate diphosphatase n=1 Tax=Desulfovibrio sp. X2 TaxID=941449 RepID=UPI00035893CF|nr:alpha-D-ribose 1-methylphosphonate 5-triphosphate diphosphatase [Desulfovibrio sp. X2]EPR43818.1 phosphonate metabolism protein PhnM [Desulfovibrio sp. X2]
MRSECVLTNAAVVLPDGIVHGTVCLADGLVRTVDEGNTALPGSVDLEGDYLIPGLIELHTDNMEGHLRPRPGVQWPSALAALISHDVQVTGAGITTVLDSICCGDLHRERDRSALLATSVEAVRSGREKDVLRADHMLHLRCEVCDPAVVDLFAPYADEPGLHLVSLMDHTPGQRQFTSMDKYRQYYRGKHLSWSDEEFEQNIDELRAQQTRHAEPNRAALLGLCRARNIPAASHDDTTAEQVRQADEEGISISEFPTSVEAAREARERGIGIVMGAPNVVRGGSHSGNVSALDLARLGLLDILSSDYVPASLLHSAFLLHEKLGVPLHEAIGTVTSAPAQFLQLSDRGAVSPGKRADLAQVRLVDGYPVVRTVYRQGTRIL